MAYSYVVYTGNGSSTDFAVPFPFLDRSHVAATVGGGATSFTWLNDGLVRFSPAPANGAEVRISRDSNRSARLSNYQDAQVLTEAQMDYDALQIFYVAQEAFDAIAAAGGGGDMLRANNLSDVFNTAAARNNIGALAKAGDQMFGPLYLYGSPSSPNEAATKAYVDSRVGAGGFVTSFNTRSGAVTLLGADVTAALGYTPVNRAGDAMTGFLTLNANPTNPLHAATKQYVDSLPGISTYDWTFRPPAPNIAAVTAEKVQSGNTGAYSGLADLQLRRAPGSTVAMSAFPIRYTVDAALNANSDICYDATIRATNMNGGGIIAGRFLAAGPRTNTGTRTLVGLSVSPAERAGDLGRKLNWLAPAHAGIHVYPDNSTNFGDGSGVGYNISFGLVFTSSGNNGGIARTHVPILIDQESVAAGGYGVLAHGGTTDVLAPEAILHAKSRWTYGIDFRNATFIDTDKTALWLAQGQAIHYGPLSRIYEGPSGDLTFYDSVVGSAKKLSELIGGGAGSLLSSDNTWTGLNTWQKVPATPGFAGRFKSGTLSPTGSSIIDMGPGYSTTLDVQRQTNAATESGNNAGTHGIFVQHVIAGTNPINTVFCGVRSQIESTQVSGASISDVVSGYFGLNHKGTNSGGFGIHVDAYHDVVGGGNTYGASVEMFIKTTNGTAIGQLIRNVDQGGGSQWGYAGLGITAAGLGGKGFSYGIKAGLFGFTLPCSYGLDLVDATCNNAAITIPSNGKVTLSSSREAGPWFRYNSSNQRIEFGAGSTVWAALSMNTGGNGGKMYFRDWIDGDMSRCFINMGAYDAFDAAVMSIRPSPGGAGGSVAGAPVSSIVVKVDGTPYRIPLYGY